MKKFAQLSAAERMDMTENGLNPFKQDHIDKYFNGQRGSIKENQERLNAIMGSDINRPIGHALETDNGTVLKLRNPDPVVTRELLMEDMNDYANSTPKAINQLQSLREPTQPSNGKLTVTEVTEKGKNLATNYYNSFINSLKNPSTTSNLEVYKNLKALLEYENKLNSSKKAKQIFQESVNKITNQMYNQIKG